MNKDIYYEEELAHYGVKGTHWGVRRYQNEDGSYKPGAEGRYYNPVKNVAKSAISNILSRRSKAQEKAKNMRSAVLSTAKGGGAAPKADQHDGQDENGTGAKAPLTGKAKLLNDIITNSKADKSYSYLGGAGGAAASSSSGSKGSKKSEEGDDFKTSTILSKFESLFKEDENWDEVELSDKDIDELDDLVKKYREWRQGNNSKTKKLKSIDSYVEKYGAWRTNHGKAKHSDMDDEFLMHYGVKGMKWGVRRYQNPDGTLTAEGRRRKKKIQNAIVGALFYNKKYRNEDGSLNDEGKARKSKGKQYTEDYWNAHDNKDPKYMTDKELQRRINRLNNENQYKNLNKSTVRKGSEKIAKDFVQTAVITALTALAANQVKKAAPKLISKGRKAVEKRIKEQSNKKWLY